MNKNGRHLILWVISLCVFIVGPSWGSDFPAALTNAVDGLPGVGTEIRAKHLNNLEAKVGINGSAVPTSLDYLVKNRYAMRAFVGDPAYPTLAAAIVTLNAAGTQGDLVVPAGNHV